MNSVNVHTYIPMQKECSRIINSIYEVPILLSHCTRNSWWFWIHILILYFFTCSSLWSYA